MAQVALDPHQHRTTAVIGISVALGVAFATALAIAVAFAIGSPARDGAPLPSAADVAAPANSDTVAGSAISEGARAPVAPVTAVVESPPNGILTYIAGDGSHVSLDVTRPDAPLAAALEVPALPAEAGVYPSPDGRYLATVRRDDEGVFLDISEGDRMITSRWLAAPTDPEFVVGKGPARAVEGVPLAVAWSPDGQHLAYGSVDGEPWNLNILSLPTWSYASAEVAGGYVGELAWSPDSSLLAISTYEIDRTDHTVLVYDSGDRTVSHLIDGCHVIWSPDGTYLAVRREPSVTSGIWLVSPDGRSRTAVTSEPDHFPLAWVYDA
jgi:WD40 repeat protein